MDLILEAIAAHHLLDLLEEEKEEPEEGLNERVRDWAYEK